MAVKDLRTRTREAWVKLVEAGKVMSLPDFASRTPEIVGEKVPLATIRDWYKDDRWGALAKVESFDVSEDMKRIRVFLEMHYHEIMNWRSSSPKDMSATASSYLRLIRATPDSLVHTIDQEVINAREALNEAALVFAKADAAKAHIGNIIRVWLELGKELLTDLSIFQDEEATVSMDSLILNQRNT